MVLVDHEISELAKDKKLLNGYDESCITSVGYDLRTAYLVNNKKEVDSILLMPGESAFAASQEAVRLPNNLLARVYLKNSRLRQGLSLEAPVYQPGHYTKAFFRLRNVSNRAIRLRAGEKYAMVVFEQLDAIPDSPYDGVFQSEIDFKDLADYTKIYEQQMEEMEQSQENIKEMERNIYANVLVILTVFVALFSFLTVNVSLFASQAGMRNFLIGNFTMLGSISFLIAVLQTTIGGRRASTVSKVFSWVATIILLAISLILFAAR